MGRMAEVNTFPTNLRGFGYGFNEAGQMRQIEEDGETLSERPFLFEVKPGNQAYNQAHYEALGEVLTEEVYSLLESAGGLQRREVEVAKEQKPRSFVFVSPEFQDKDQLLVIIHGSGVVRAGQWARRLIINEDLDKGTILPYLKEALGQNWGVIVLNTNHNSVNGKPIKGSETPEDHANTVWANLVAPTKATKVAVVAHSYGGLVSVELAHTYREDFLQRVKALLLTDSVHGRLTGDDRLDKHLVAIGRNWVSSNKPLGDLIKIGGNIQRVSAGHEKHEWTSWAAREQIFQVLRDVAQEKQWQQDNTKEELAPQKRTNNGEEL